MLVPGEFCRHAALREDVRANYDEILDEGRRSYTGGNDEVGKDVAMHIAASKPQFVDESEVPESVLAKEKEILVIICDPK